MIEPQIAAVVIERALARPSSGMPSSWRKTTVAQTHKRRGGRNKGGIGKMLKNLFGSVGHLLQSVKFLLPAAAAIALLIQSGSIDNLKNFDLKKIIPARQESIPSATKKRKPSAYLTLRPQREERQGTPQKKLQTKQQHKSPKKTSSLVSAPEEPRAISTKNQPLMSFNYQKQINVNALEQLQSKNF